MPVLHRRMSECMKLEKTSLNPILPEPRVWPQLPPDRCWEHRSGTGSVGEPSTTSCLICGHTSAGGERPQTSQGWRWESCQVVDGSHTAGKLLLIFFSFFCPCSTPGSHLFWIFFSKELSKNGLHLLLDVCPGFFVDKAHTNTTWLN